MRIYWPDRDPAEPPRDRRDLLTVVGLFVFVIVTRLPALLSPKALDDEQVYAVVAREMLHGGKPYLDAVERKPPLLFVLYEQILRFGGEHPLAIHVVTVLWTLATMAVLYLIARRLFSRTAGYWAAFLYALFTAWADYRSLALNGELLMNLPAMAAVAIAFHRGRSRWRPELLAAGALVTLAFLLKQPSGIVIAALGAYLLTPDYRRERQLAPGHSLLHGALLTIGFTGAFLIAGAWLWTEGILNEAIYWTVLDHGVPLGPTTWPFWRGALIRGSFFLVSALPLWLGALESVHPRLRARGIWVGRRAEYWGLLFLLGGSAIGVSASGQFLYHYFLQLVPVLALLAAPVFAQWWEAEAPRGGVLPGRATLTPWLALVAIVFLVVNAIGVAKHDTPGAAASYVRAHSGANDRLFVWGQGDRFTGFYLDADRRPASRYIATYPLTGHIFGVWDPAVNTSNRIVGGAWDSLRVDFGRHPPRYIIDTDGIFQPPAYPISRYAFLRDYLHLNYRQVYRASDGVVYERLETLERRS
ncbi:MAG TPA: glycosyltransferase family 39 protein [Gemmatimonadales bacterium]|nr:glycosyltransferase family 39 protein [Gemmatimonadales bacterium]